MTRVPLPPATTPRWLLDDSAFRAAMRAVTRGWPVFPLRPYAKRPAVAGWERYATTDMDQIRAWWRAAAYNVGVACGPAGLVVLDLDVAADGSAPAGTESLLRIASLAGEYVPVTYAVATPSGGRHLYFAAPPSDRLPNTAGALGPHVDTRGAGGYVVAAGSVRRIRGGLVPYEAVDERDPVELPDWLHRLLIPQLSRQSVTAIAPARSGAYAAAALARETHAVRRARTGTRNHVLFRAAVHLGQLCGAGLLDREEVAAALCAAAGRHVGTEGFTATEARRAVSNGLDRGMRRPRRIAGLGE